MQQEESNELSEEAKEQIWKRIENHRKRINFLNEKKQQVTDESFLRPDIMEEFQEKNFTELLTKIKTRTNKICHEEISTELIVEISHLNNCQTLLKG